MSREAQGSETVRAIQALLEQLGFDPGPADGIDRPATRQAIEAFQRAQGLPVTGEATADLLLQLMLVDAAPHRPRPGSLRPNRVSRGSLSCGVVRWRQIGCDRRHNPAAVMNKRAVGVMTSSGGRSGPATATIGHRVSRVDPERSPRSPLPGDRKGPGCGHSLSSGTVWYGGRNQGHLALDPLGGTLGAQGARRVNSLPRARPASH